MKIAYFSSAFSIHTVRWVNEIAKRGYEIHLITMHSPRTDNLVDNSVSIYMLLFYPPLDSNRSIYYYDKLISKEKI